MSKSVMKSAPAFALVLSNEDVVHDALTLVWHRVQTRWTIARLLTIPD